MISLNPNDPVPRMRWRRALGGGVSALGLVGLTATAALAADGGASSTPSMGSAELQYGVCVSCHGAHGEGRPELQGPRIGDLEAGYVELQLKAYRGGGRGGASVPSSMPMVAVAQGLTDEQIASLGAYVAGLSPEQRSPGEPVEGGEAAYASCAACHGADARGVPAMSAPDLLYQDSADLKLQLQLYRDGKRGGTGSPSMAASMAAVSKGLDDATIDLVVAHIASLRPERAAQAEPAGSVTEEEGLTAFADIYAVSQSPRCMNCHPAGDAPLQTDASRPHNMGVTRQSPSVGLHCSTCHSAAASYNGQAPLPPSDTIWSLAPQDMVFEGRSAAELCAQLTDVEINGGRGPVELTEHVANDHLLITSWHSGRTPPPISHEELVARFETWADAGAPCPE